MLTAPWPLAPFQAAFSLLEWSALLLHQLDYGTSKKAVDKIVESQGHLLTNILTKRPIGTRPHHVLADQTCCVFWYPTGIFVL